MNDASAPTPSRAAALRRLLATPGPIVIAGAHDGLTARLV
jgi:2-methylisocitrate lyase-like PEP mutase family enzyme